MYSRKYPLTDGEVYHVFTRSIAGFKICNNDFEFLRMKDAIRYYQNKKPALKFSDFLRSRGNQKYADRGPNLRSEQLVNIIAFCLMPTHMHLLVKQLTDNGTSIFMSNVLNSYTRYFNIKYKRKGPLWEGRFKNVLVQTNEQILHLTRYLHLNPVTAYLVDKPEEWLASSYQEYISTVEESEKVCQYDELIDIDPLQYKSFLLDRLDYQRNLGKIKKLIIE